MLHALVIEDDLGFGRTLQRVLARQGYEVSRAMELAEARRLMGTREFDLVLVDQHLPDGNGLTLLAELVAQPYRPVVIMVTGAERLSSTVEAIQRGAYDYFVKPPDLDALVGVIERAQQERELRDQIAAQPRRAVQEDETDAQIDEVIVGSSPPMLEVFKQVARVAPTSTNILLTGESGTGKELVARAIHEVSRRVDRPFVAVNCAALNPTLVESELFGHGRGSFTGATRDRPGRFELAADGTLLLDEIGELELELQGKLLRAIEERTFERVGEAKGRPFEARLICATHRNLPQDIISGRFREDLYFRVGVVEIHLPPLRERGDDIGTIATHMLRRLAKRLEKPELTFDPAALALMAGYRWPGNVRQLRNVVERCAIMATNIITPQYLRDAGVVDSDSEQPAAVVRTSESTEPRTLADMERQHIDAILQQVGWVKKQAAAVLGISRPTLDRKIQLYDLRPRE